MLLMVKEDKAFNPTDVGALGLQAVAACAHGDANLFEKFGHGWYSAKVGWED